MKKSTISVLLTLLLASSTGCTILNDSQSSIETCSEKSIGKMNKVEKRSKGKNDIAKLTFEGSIQTPDEYVPETTINVRSKTP